MRKVIAFAAVAGVVLSARLTAAAADELLARGQAEFRAANYAAAVPDLMAAADTSFAEAQDQPAGTTRTAALDRFETALVYAAVAYARSGRESEALEPIVRLAAAERVEQRYAQLPLTLEVADFADLAVRLAPGQLPPNRALANADVFLETPGLPKPPATTTEAAAAAPAATTTTAAAATAQPAAPPATAPQPAPAPPKPAAPQTPAPQPQPEPVRPAAQPEPVTRVAPAPQPAPCPPPTTVYVPVPTPAPSSTVAVPQPVAPRRSGIDPATADLLREAETYASRGDTASASDIYERLLATRDPSRETLAEAATGFYRIGAYDRARFAFDRLGPLARGEEDLRYYKAVSLFETGAYYDARRELACALPYIEVTDDVAHYRAMIEEMAEASGRRSLSLE